MVNLGQRLHNQRLQRKLTLEEVAVATKIKPRFLAAIEKGDYSKFPSPTYAQGFVKNYAAYLGLPKTEVTALFRREFDEKRVYKVLPDSLAKKQEYPTVTFRWRQQFLLLPALLLILGAYLLFQYRAVFFPPALSVYTPKENSTVDQNITITGKADEGTSVFINNDQVSLSTDGTFQKSVSLFPGKTQVIIVAKNKFGKQTTIQRTVTVK
jgi:cytoskeletal protein RodZ